MDIVFDFDGTLVDSREQVLKTTQLLVAEMTGEQVSDAELNRREAGTFAATFANHGIGADALARAVPRWGELSLSHAYEPFPGMVELLVELRRRGHRLHIWTARDHHSTHRILAACELASHFDGKIGCWELSLSKPDPRSLERVVDGAPPDQVVVIGDGSTDLIGGTQYGATIVSAVWSPHANPKELRSLGAQRLVYRPEECLSHIDALEPRGSPVGA